MYRIKKILNDLVDIAYRNEPEEKRKAYKGFYIDVMDKNWKSFHGRYFPSKRKIEIYNTYRSDQAVIATTIHELSHHIDHMNRGRNLSDPHGKPFYDVFRKLLFTALDMGIFDKDGFLEATRDASDSNKIARMLENYVLHPVSYKTGESLVIVNNGYDIKEHLKGKGFLYNHINRTWELETDDVEKIKTFLDELSADYSVKDANNIEFTPREPSEKKPYKKHKRKW